MKIVAKQIIFGCDSRGDGESPYMTRYAFPRVGPFRVCVHVFHRSDADELHDHPWGFLSIILWRGYVEVTPATFEDLRRGATIAPGGAFVWRKRKWPGMALFRPAVHAHRVELLEGKRAISLVVMGPRKREWGFFTARGWQEWKAYFTERGC